MWWVHDLEHELMGYCLRRKGKWWANHFFRNREVNELYARMRKKRVDYVYDILGDEAV